MPGGAFWTRPGCTARANKRRWILKRWLLWSFLFWNSHAMSCWFISCKESEHCLTARLLLCGFSQITKNLTFSSHPHFEAFLESTMLTLISMMLVYGAVFVTSALVRQVPSHRTFEKALATCKKNEGKLWISAFRSIFLVIYNQSWVSTLFPFD